MKTLIGKLQKHSAMLRNVGGEDETTLMLDDSVLEIERLNKHCRDLDAKLFKTVLECRTFVDAAMKRDEK